MRRLQFVRSRSGMCSKPPGLTPFWSCQPAARALSRASTRTPRSMSRSTISRLRPLPHVHRACQTRSGSGKKTNVIVYAGDGGTLDIGIQAMSGAFERGTDFLYICYDNEAYGNTGMQRSGRHPYGRTDHDHPDRKDRCRKRTSMRSSPPTTRPTWQLRAAPTRRIFSRKLQKALTFRGPTFIHILAPCPPGWRYPTEKTDRDGQACGEVRYVGALRARVRETLHQRPIKSSDEKTASRSKITSRRRDGSRVLMQRPLETLKQHLAKNLKKLAAEEAASMKKIATGNKAVAEAVKQAKPAVVAAYPITPQTEIVETDRRFCHERADLRAGISRSRASTPRWQPASVPASPVCGRSLPPVPTGCCICTR